MSNSYVKIIVHITFHVRSGGMVIHAQDLERMFSYISGIVKNMGGTSIIVGGMPDHVHILCTLPKQISLVDFIRTIKAESSKWIKQLGSEYRLFSWQDGYGAFSVSSSMVDRTFHYIENQAEHHSKQSFRDEYRRFFEAYGIPFDEKYL